MKAIVPRENIRKLKLNPYLSKDAQSQSPPQKKLLKKIQMIHMEPSNKNDLSLKENLLVREPKEETDVDFRVEIERRFMKAVTNHIFKFPRREVSSHEESAISSLNNSFESLKHVTTYDLSSQNKKKSGDNKHKVRITIKDDDRVLESASIDQREDMSSSNDSSSRELQNEEKSGVPIELRIRDKSSTTYKRLRDMLDKQLKLAHNGLYNQNPAPEENQKQLVEQAEQEQKNKNVAQHYEALKTDIKAESTADVKSIEHDQDLEAHKLDQYKKKNERNVKSQGRQERPPYNITDLLRRAKLTSNSKLQSRKNLSEEKHGGRHEPTSASRISVMDKTSGRLSSHTSKGESKISINLTKVSHESFKKLYNSHILKAITPQYIKNNQVNSHKEAILKTHSQESCPLSNDKAVLSALYLKAKNEVLNNKLKVSAVSPARYHARNGVTSISAIKKEETPKSNIRKLNLNNRCRSPGSVLDKSSPTLEFPVQNILVKKESVQHFQKASSYIKTSEVTNYASNDSSAQLKIIKKPNFKLDLQKGTQAYRDVLSSNRNRKKKSAANCGEGLSTDSRMRTSTDINHYSYALNSSTQKNASKKQISIVPMANTAKNISSTKTVFTFK